MYLYSTIVRMVSYKSILIGGIYGMDKKKVQKLNRAAVATVLAASGVSVITPAMTEASVKFKDLDPRAYYYQPVLQLAERGVLAGFGDGTFRPNSSVTRGQAAIMIAKSVGLNTSNVKNPGFRDVSTKDPMYKYIAALANQGAISGYMDKTFRPNEPITRGQMAKIITLAYGFEKATTLNHDFADVKSNNPFAHDIQTIFNLKITSGVSPISFAPNQRVSRGQMASFIIRAENATSDYKPVKEIGNITDTTVYINGVAHYIDPSLRNIINPTNKDVLKGAHIEGDIKGATLKSITKLTLNASGTASKHLILDGKDTTFTGEVIIQGNYLRFKNWNVTGAVTIAETPPRTIGSLDRMQNMRLASISGFGFIDWEKPTNPDNGGDNSSGDGDLVEKPPGGNNGNKVVDRMPAIEKYVDFTNSIVKRLIIEQNRTYVVASKTLPHVTVQRNVREFEIYTDITTLYIETDVNTTMYGVSDIKTVYKNSFKSVYFNSDSFVEKLIADNSYGWIDLGDNFYADKVIIPPNKGPNDIFNDYINDSDKIGNIEDSNGNEVDPDPDNPVVPDYEAPTLFIDDDIKTQGSTATVTMESNEDGIIYYMVREEDERPPTIREILEGTNEKWAGNTAVSEGVPKAITITGLDDKKKYVIYAVAVDDAGNVSDKESAKFEIVDSTPPTIKPVTAVGLPGGKRIKVTINPDEKGTYYYYYRPTVDATEDPTAQGIIDRFEANNSRTGSGKVDAAGQLDFTIPNLDALTSYDVYVVMKDEYGNLTPVPEKVTVSTAELDNVHPYIVDGKLYRENNTSTDFYFYVNELLDPVTANNPNNYRLSGTGIVNVVGQKEIIPDSVKFEPSSGPSGAKGKITISIPSVTGFVNGDTLRVKVDRKVTDLAENAFINEDIITNIEDLRNFADYTHSDALSPILKNLNFTPNHNETKGILEFNSNKAGTYYYMILPDDFSIFANGITSRDFYNEFSSVSSEHSGKFDTGTGKAYIQIDGHNNKYPVVVGDQQTVINLPATPPRDPFKSYSIYMIVKDRSGLLSGIMNVSALSDSKAPFITGYDVKATENTNTSIDVSFTMSEKGNAYYQAIPKWIETTDSSGAIIKELNPRIAELDGMTDDERAKAIKAAGSTYSVGAAGSYTAKVNGLNPHAEYVVYLSAEDKFGNITNHPAVVDPSTNTLMHGSGSLKTEVYTDGIQPKIGQTLKRSLLTDFDDFEGRRVNVSWGASSSIGDGIIEYIDNRTFTVSFSEAISIASGSATPVPIDNAATLNTLRNYLQNQLGTTIKDIEWQDLTDIKSWQERNLVITFNGDVTSSAIIDMKDPTLANVLDLARKSFSDAAYKATYEHPTVNHINKMREAVLVEQSLTGSTYKSHKLGVLLELGVNVDWKQRYYYATTSTAQNILSIAEANAIVKAIKTNQPIQGAANVIVYGKDDISSSNQTSIYREFNTQTMPNATPNDVFQEGQHLFVFTVDMYGNIIWAVDKNDDTKKYRIIEKQL